MKILVILKWFVKYNGTAKVAYELSKRFEENNNNVLIVSYKDYVDPKWEHELKVYKLKYKGFFALREIRRIIHEFKPDIIHSHDWIGLLGLSKDIPQVATNHSYWPKDLFLSTKHFVSGFVHGIPHYLKLRLSSKVVSVSKYLQKQYEKLGIKSLVIYNGVDERFLKRPDENIELKHPSTLFVGRLDNRKAKYLIQIIKLINNYYKNEEVYHYIIGPPADKNLVKKIKCMENVYYLGVVDDVKSYYYNADVLVFPSVFESFGLVPVEAQACGLPVVAFNVCSLGEIIKNGETGFLVKKGDLTSLVKKTIDILENDDLRKKMSKNAVKNVKERFMWDDKVDEYLRLFNSLIEG